MSGSGSRFPPILAWIPWWLSVIMAIVSYVCLKYLAPHLAISAGLTPLAGVLPQLAPLAAIAFLLLAAALLYDGDDPPPEDAPEDQDDTPGDQDDAPEDQDDAPGAALASDGACHRADWRRL